MRCKRCSAVNPPESNYCERCGNTLHASGDEWLWKVAAVIAIIIFLPVGLCGLVYTIGAASELPDPGQDPAYVYMFGLFGLGCLVIGGLMVYFAVVKLFKK
jgi:hypothetical protein